MKNNNKKYEKYAVRVSFKNGNEELIKFKGVHTSNYNSMLKVYRDFRDEHQDDANISTIDFLGIGSEGEINIFWSKKVAAVSDSDLNKDCREVVSEIQYRINLLKKMKEHHASIVSKCERQKDTLYHMIESNENNKFRDDHEEITFKLDIFDRMEKLSHIRRNSKNHVSDLGHILPELDKINLQPWTRYRKQYKLTSKEYENKMNTEQFYNDEIEKQNIINEFNSKYNNYIIDESNKSIYFYNKIYNKPNNKLNDQKQQATNNKLSKNSNRLVG